jgi:hypothetical protein
MTMLQLQMDVQNDFTMQKIYMVIQQFLLWEGKEHQPVNNLSSICIVFCCPRIKAGWSSEK